MCVPAGLCGALVGEFMGLAPGKREIDVPSCEIYEMKGDTVMSTWTYGDPGQLFRQIADPAESGAAR